MSRVISDPRPVNPETASGPRPPPTAAQGRIQDAIGRTLIVIFVTKPVIDLFWQFYFFIGPIRLSPTTVIGFLIVVYFLPFRFKYAQYAPPFARIFEAFIALNLACVVIGLATDPHARPAAAFDTLIRILGCYLVFFCTYAAARRFQYTTSGPFIRSMVIGTALAVIINLLAIKLGYGGAKFGSSLSGPYREAGLYFDPGSLGAFALYNLIFTVFYLHFTKRRKALWLLVIVAFALIDLYLMALSGSRAPMVQLAIAALVYAWYLRGWGRIAAPVVAVLLLMSTGALLVDQPGNVFERFQGDIAALESDAPGVSESTSGDVSLGRFEALGNNRGMLWANALTAIFRQSMPEIIFGSYFSRIRAHSDYIDILARNGVVGLGLYVLLIYGLCVKTLALARVSTEGDRRTTQALAGLLLACYAFYCFPFRPLLYTTTNWYMWAIVGLALAGVSRKTTPAVAGRSGDNARTSPSVAAPRPGSSVNWQAGSAGPVRRN